VVIYGKQSTSDWIAGVVANPQPRQNKGPKSLTGYIWTKMMEYRVKGK
jgi:hypothetical protein